MKRLLSVILAAALALLLTVDTLAARSGFSNFTYTDNYTSGQFGDVGGSEWYAQYVEGACNYGFFKGKSFDLFDPGGPLTVGEAVTLAARLMSIYQTGQADFIESSPYYEVYAEYALENGIIDSHLDYTADVTRARFAELLRNSLPGDAYPVINPIPDYAICDVEFGAGYGGAVYTLYRAGVLTGSDRFGTFFPDMNITRAEACAVMVRIADPDARIRIDLPAQIPAEVIFQRSNDAVFLIETFDEDGETIRTGSGFFISGAGLAVTNLHVIDNAASAIITLSGGEEYPVRGVHAVSDEHNLAMISVDSGIGGWSYLRLADSDLIEVGNTVYALGSPLGLINTMTEGIVSHKDREVDGDLMIQFTAPISFGSGGSALLNARGQVIGVASSSFSYGQNLNLAVPVNYVKELTPGECVPLEARLQR